jgi:serine/threonine protein kinase
MPVFIPFQLGRFTVVDRVRAGGMSEVLEGQYITDDGEMMKVAIKRPLPTPDESHQLMLMFWEECALMERVDHDLFPKFICSGITTGVPYLAMEFVKGKDLRLLLDELRNNNLNVSPMAWVLVAAQLSEAVAYLHSLQTNQKKPILHGDISPRNIMLDREGIPRLLDLGIASRFSNGDIPYNPNNIFQPPYLANDDTKPTQDLDTYAIARVLLECLGGTSLKSIEELGLPKPLQATLNRALDPEGKNNYIDARELATDLQVSLNFKRIDEFRDELSKLVRTP